MFRKVTEDHKKEMLRERDCFGGPIVGTGKRKMRGERGLGNEKKNGKWVLTSSAGRKERPLKKRAGDRGGEVGLLEKKEGMTET